MPAREINEIFNELANVLCCWLATSDYTKTPRGLAGRFWLPSYELLLSVAPDALIHTNNRSKPRSYGLYHGVALEELAVVVAVHR